LSTLGKILAVLVALVSIAVAVLVAREFVLTKDWKALYDDAVKLDNKAMDDLATVIKERNDEKARWDADRTVLQEQIQIVTNDLNDKRTQVAALNGRIENQESRLATLADQYTHLQTDLTACIRDRDQYRTDRDLAMKKADDYTLMYAELEVRWRAAQADLVNLKNTLRTTQELLAGKEGELAFILQEHPEWKMPGNTFVAPLPKVSAMVLTADNQARTAEINVGSDAGVVKGMKFIIYSEPNTYLATLTITVVGNNKAAGTLTVISGTVKANDHVTNKYID
jgi:hypothetical protein